jgi:hypothetical protein
MPPADSHKGLSVRDRALLRRWVAEGAGYEPHWSFRPIRRPAIPAPSQSASPAAPIANPIDAFVLAELGGHGLQPSPPANRRTLLRRLSLDLIGLPPTPAETRAFVADTRPDAWERQVERLLASPH